jgi:hypothetical protein
VSLDEVLKATVEATVRAALERALTERLAGDAINVIAPPDDRPLDAKALQDRGYSLNEAYVLLDKYGQRLPGARRARIAKSVLDQVERGELSPELSQAFHARQAGVKGARQQVARSGS